MKTTGPRRNRKLQGIDFSLLLAIGVIGCRGHAAILPVQQKTVQQATEPSAHAGVETEQERSCGEFVQGFYDWYLTPAKKDRNHLDGELDMDDAILLKRGDMSVELYSLLKADRDAQAHAKEIVGLESDPFTNSQDNSAKFEVKSSIVQDGSCRAVVWGVESGSHRETVEPDLREKDGKWEFVDFRYPGLAAPWDSLISELVFLRSRRKHLKA